MLEIWLPEREEEEEEEILTSRGSLHGSIVGRRRVATSCVVGGGTERLFLEMVELAKKSLFISLSLAPSW